MADWDEVVGRLDTIVGATKSLYYDMLSAGADGDVMADQIAALCSAAECKLDTAIHQARVCAKRARQLEIGGEASE